RRSREVSGSWRHRLSGQASEYGTVALAAPGRSASGGAPALNHNGVDSKVNILLVDDRPENLLAVQAMLEQPEYDLVTARPGREALKCVLQDRDFAVIILDVKMAGMDGFETAAILRQRDKTRHTPIIFLTAHGREHEKVLQ